MSLVLKRALDQAAIWHRDQRRKYPGADVPYLSHLAGVTIVLARHGFAEDVLVAGALHDAVEDTEATLADIERLFGPNVATLVEHCTEQDRSQPWEIRKQQYIDRFPHGPWEAQAISLADKIDNLESIVVCAREYGDPWAQFKRGRAEQIARYTALRDAALRLPAHALVSEYVAALADVERLA